VLLNISPPERRVQRGFCFEHDREPPAGWTCDHRYRAVNPAHPCELWRPAVSLRLRGTYHCDPT
jgi:hypothetical protein